MGKVHKNDASENVVLRKVFGTKTGDVTGDLRKLHSEELRG
jgi:hypothetical protein